MLNSQVVDPGQWGAVVQSADPQATVVSALAAGLVGLVVKRSDGTTAEPWLSAYTALAAAARAAHLLVIPWLIVYPDDSPTSAWQQLLSGAQADAGGLPLVLEPPMTDWSGQVAQSRALWSYLRGTGGPAPLYFTWGDPSAQPAFPWATWNAGAAALVPEIYPAAYGVPPAVAYNRAFLGGISNGPGVEEMAPAPRAVVPCFDLSDPAACAALAHNGGFGAVWWYGPSGAFPASLAETPYAAQRTNPRSAFSAADAVALLQAEGDIQQVLRGAG